jgi:Kef-type K+ transport system membrane component KefB
LGVTLAFFLYPGLAGSKATPVSFALFVGTAMAITAFPVLARLLTEKNIQGTRVGTIVLTCAAVDDVIALGHGQGLPSVALTVGLTLLFTLCMLLAVRPLLCSAARRIHLKQVLVALSIVLLLLSAYCTNAIGVHPVFGAFLMGIILPRSVLSIELVRDSNRVNALLFLPLFFVYSGLRTQIGLINSA